MRYMLLLCALCQTGMATLSFTSIIEDGLNPSVDVDDQMLWQAAANTFVLARHGSRNSRHAGMASGPARSVRLHGRHGNSNVLQHSRQNMFWRRGHHEGNFEPDDLTRLGGAEMHAAHGGAANELEMHSLTITNVKNSGSLFSNTTRTKASIAALTLVEVSENSIDTSESGVGMNTVIGLTNASAGSEPSAASSIVEFTNANAAGESDASMEWSSKPPTDQGSIPFCGLQSQTDFAVVPWTTIRIFHASFSPTTNGEPYQSDKDGIVCKLYTKCSNENPVKGIGQECVGSYWILVIVAPISVSLLIMFGTSYEFRIARERYYGQLPTFKSSRVTFLSLCGAVFWAVAVGLLSTQFVKSYALGNLTDVSKDFHIYAFPLVCFFFMIFCIISAFRYTCVDFIWPDFRSSPFLHVAGILRAFVYFALEDYLTSMECGQLTLYMREFMGSLCTLLALGYAPPNLGIITSLYYYFRIYMYEFDFWGDSTGKAVRTFHIFAFPDAFVNVLTAILCLSTPYSRDRLFIATTGTFLRAALRTGQQPSPSESIVCIRICLFVPLAVASVLLMRYQRVLPYHLQKVKYLRLSYLYKMRREGTLIMRCQDAPDEAFGNPAKAQHLISISHRWLDRFTCDVVTQKCPGGVRVESLCNRFEKYFPQNWPTCPEMCCKPFSTLYNAICSALYSSHDVLIFLDFMAIPQIGKLPDGTIIERTPLEKHIVEHVLPAMGTLYTLCPVLVSPEVHDGVAPYTASGWCFCEYIEASLHSRLYPYSDDFQYEQGEGNDPHDTKASCAVASANQAFDPHVFLQSFEARLREKVFLVKRDREYVRKIIKYAMTNRMLHEAVLEQDAEKLDNLLSKGSKAQMRKHINHPVDDTSLDTLLHVANRLPSIDIVDLLIEHGADMELPNFRGDIPTDLFGIPRSWLFCLHSPCDHEHRSRSQFKKLIVDGGKVDESHVKAATRIQAVFRGGEDRRKVCSMVLDKLLRAGEENRRFLDNYESQFMVVCNKPQCDEHWDSTDEAWVGRASMSKNHRFLIRKDLHWQWFNALVFGMVDCTLQEAIKETEVMLSAAKTFGANAIERLGWSKNVGYYFQICGHSAVQSLHMHIVDLDCTGPTFDKLRHKNIPVDEVLKCLQAEARGEILPGAASRYNEPDGPILEGQSLRQELAKRYPKMNCAADLQLVRKTLRSLGGAEAIKQELVSGRFLDEEFPTLTTGTNPFNVFARLAFLECATISNSTMTRLQLQINSPKVAAAPRLAARFLLMSEEQAAIKIQAVFRGGQSRRRILEKNVAGRNRAKADIKNFLGEFESKFMVVCNLPQNDEHYASTDKEWVGRASMSKNHRFLIRRDLHWQFFNGLVFGTVDCTLQEAINETETMLTAAKTFAANAAKYSGWSTNIGYYVHIYGHNSVNSLHIHIVDLDNAGPTLDYMTYKNMPVDEVVKCLQAEARGEILPGAAARYNEPDDPILEGQTFKKELVKRYPKLSDAAGFQLIRKTLRNLGGAEAIKQELLAARFLNEGSPMLTTGTNPRNVFAHMAALEKQAESKKAQFHFGKIKQRVQKKSTKAVLNASLLAGGLLHEHELQAALKIQAVFRGGQSRKAVSELVVQRIHRASEEDSHFLEEYESKFMVVCNMPANDEHYASADEAWVGRASMSKHHRFLIRKDLHWQFFNGIVFGLVDCTLQEAIHETEVMHTAAKTFAANAAKHLGWSTNIGYYLHIFGYNSVNSLHIHIVDLDYTGPTFDKISSHNMPVDEVVKALQAEARGEILPGAATRYNDPDDPVPNGQKLKHYLVKRYPKLNEAADFQLVRKTLRNLGGAEALSKELLVDHFLEKGSSMLTTGTNPLNVFAHIAFLESGKKAKGVIMNKVHHDHGEDATSMTMATVKLLGNQ